MSCELYKNKYSRVPFSDIGFNNNQLYNNIVISKLYVNVDSGKENMNPNLDSVSSIETIVFETPQKLNSNASINELNKDILLPLNGDKIDQYNTLRYLCERTSSFENTSISEPDNLSYNLEPSTSYAFSSPITKSAYRQPITPIKPSPNKTPKAATPSLCSEITPEVKMTIAPAPKVKKNEESTPKEDAKLHSSYVSEELSPEMFSEDEVVNTSATEEAVNKSIGPELQRNNPQDRKLLRRLHRSYRGVLPPPSITHCKLTIENMLDAYYQNEELWITPGDTSFNDSNVVNTSLNDSLSRVNMNNCTLEEALQYDWPKTTELRYHGLHYNRSKVSEEIEHLCQKLGERYVGNEMASSCTVWSIDAPSSAKKRQILRKQQLICKSPGSRLSHLAKRRITFSKENLCPSSVLPSITTTKRQMVFNVKKTETLVRRRISPRKRLFSASPHKRMISPRKRFKMSPRKQMKSPGKALRKTPKKTPRKTPKKTPRKTPCKSTRTPSSSSKKTVRRRLLSNYEETNYPGIPSVSSVTSTSSRSSNLKRALFQSPDQKIVPSTLTHRNSPSKVRKSSRALFTAPENDDMGRKRKRTDDCEQDFTPQRDKLPRSFSTTDVPSNVQKGTILQRRNTEISLPGNSAVDFSEHHKKKLLWAISTALRTQNIGWKHPNFKTYATSLSQLCRRLLPDLLPGAVRVSEGSTKERMSKLLNQHVYAIVKGSKTVDEIVLEVKSKSSSLIQKPKGYIPLTINETTERSNNS